MIVFGIEGTAGSGKTSRLMEKLADTLELTPLDTGQRVLALTFMHGARRRLHDRLHRVAGLAGRFECVTIDSFALRLLRRWRTLAAALRIAIPEETDFDAQCEGAGVLLEREDVQAWVAASYPIMLVDEAQDLKPQRLRMVSGLANAIRTFIAADEFQCLDASLRPNPSVA